MEDSCFSMDSENPSMKELSMISAATPIAIPAMESEDTVRTKPELDLLNICLHAIRVISESFTFRSVLDGGKE